MSVTSDPGFRPQYHELHRVGRAGWWRSVVGSLLLIVLVFAVVPLVAGGIAVVALMASGSSATEAARALDITQEVTPTALAVVNIVLASAIPLAWLVSWALHGLKPRWLASIAPRIRWKYLLACLGLSVVALVASLIVAVLLPTGSGGEPVGALNEFTERTRNFLLVILLLTPFQAAGEEYLFRGYLTQAFGSLVRARQVARVLAVVGPALIFALFHGLSQAPPVFFDRFAFGVVAGILVLRTGGLEAGIAMHVLNNFLAYGLALAFGDFTEAVNATGASSWWMIFSTLTQSLVYLGLALWVARAMRLSTTGPAVGGALPPGPGDPVFEASPPRV